MAVFYPGVGAILGALVGIFLSDFEISLVFVESLLGAIVGGLVYRSRSAADRLTTSDEQANAPAEETEPAGRIGLSCTFLGLGPVVAGCIWDGEKSAAGLVAILVPTPRNPQNHKVS